MCDKGISNINSGSRISSRDKNTLLGEAVNNHSALPLTSILTPQHTLNSSLVCHLYLLPLSLYYDSLPYQSFPLHDQLPYQPIFATVLLTFTTLLKTLYLNYVY